MAHSIEPELSKEQIEQLVEKYDPELNFRRLVGLSAVFVTIVSFALSSFHVYTAGFGLLNEIAHRATHLTAVLGLIFLVFPRQARMSTPAEWVVALGMVAFYVLIGWNLLESLGSKVPLAGRIVFGSAVAALALLSLPLRIFDGDRTTISLRDWLFAAVAASFSAYLLLFFDDIYIRRVGSPAPQDYMMGVIAIIMVIEATRRTMGLALPIIGVLCLLYGMFGPYLPGMLAHRGYDIARIVNHIYIGTEGIYGIPVGVVATFVFHYVLFGVLMQYTGVGQLFIDLATIAAGRFSGGPAKVSVVSSGLFGMISGSSIANSVTTGTLTIPMMKKVGFSPRFAAGVEASASCGGQVTPPIMGAAAFIMAETLGIPYNHLILVAIVPALFHYVAILLMVHYEARRLRLAGIPAEQIPRIGAVLRSSWHLFIPLVAMVTLLLMQYTPFLAAFWGIILTVACSYVPPLWKGLTGQVMAGKTMYPRALVEGFELGAKYALGIGAACACVGFILGITTLTGMGFKFSAAVLEASGGLAAAVLAFDFTGLIELKSMTIFFGLLFTAIACIIMGAGIPTTPTYIILAAIIAPALAGLGVPQLATHMFVFYFGVLADVTPPVALAAFATAGIAGSEPMRTGVTAFRLSMGKGLVPFMFVYAPALLFIDFTWTEFLFNLIGGLVGIYGLSIAFTGFLRAELTRIEIGLLILFSLLMVFNSPTLTLVAGAVVLATLGQHVLRHGRAARAA